MNGKIFIIDGISNSGKTSFCEFLAENGYCIVEEAPAFIEKNVDLGHLANTVPKTLEEEKKNQDVLFNTEMERLRVAKDYAASGKNVVMDRSFLSTVAMAYALDVNLPFKGAYDYSRELEKRYLTAINGIDKSIGVSFIFFDVNRDVLIERNKSREKSLDAEWIDEEFLKKQNYLFFASAATLDARIIDTSHLSFEEIAKLVCGEDYKNKI